MWHAVNLFFSRFKMQDKDFFNRLLCIFINIFEFGCYWKWDNDFQQTYIALSLNIGGGVNMFENFDAH